VTFDSAYGALATVFRTGYTFNGWFTEASSGTEVNTSTIYTIDGDSTLFAQWIANPYQVAFDSNEPSTSVVSPAGTMSNQAFVYDISQAITPNAFVITGFSFSGWNTSQAAAQNGTTEFDPGENVSNLSS
jgi:uncharacterized repeat protein (TIGR02543 family)